jgi:hypothetical protein
MKHDCRSALTGTVRGRIKDKRPDGSLVMDEHFYPTSLSVHAVPALHRHLGEVAGLMRACAQNLAQRIGSPGQSGVADVTGTTPMVITRPLLDKPAPGWRHDLPGPNQSTSTEPYPPALSNPPNHVDDVYLELARATMRVGRPACSAGSSAKATFRAGQILTRTGAVIGAVTGLFDAAQAGMAASRTMKAGDSLRLIAGQSHHRGGSTGGAGTLAQEERLEYRLVLPCFHPEHSNYQWTLRILLEGDNPNTEGVGEVAASGNLDVPTVPLMANEAAKSPRNVSYQAEPGTPTVKTRSAMSPISSALQVVDISGALVFKPIERRQRVEAAILTPTYWPDRNISEGYAGLTLTTYSNL